MRSPSRTGGGDALNLHFPADLLHLFVLSCFAIAQPLLDLLAQYPTFFVSHATEPEDIVFFAALLLLVPPLVPVAVEVVAAWLRPGWRPAVRSVAVFALMTLIVLPVAVRVPHGQGWGGLLLALLAGAAFSYAYLRFSALRLFTTILTPILVLTPALFLFDGAIWKLISDSDAGVSKKVREDRKDVTIANPVPVFVLVLDELPVTSLMDAPGHIDAGRFPNFAALAATSTWYRNATTVSDATHVSVPAIVTGRYPSQQGKRLSKRDGPTYGNYRRNLFVMLSGDYAIKSIESNTRLCPRGVCERIIASQPLADRMHGLLRDASAIYLNIITPPGFGNLVPGVGGMWGGFWGEEEGKPGKGWQRALKRRRKRNLRAKFGDNRVYRFREFVDAIEGSDKPVMYFLHVLLPHAPWVLAPSGMRNTKRGQWPAGQLRKQSKWVESEFLTTQAFQRHLLQLGFVDALLGEYMAKLKEVGLFDRALIAVTADHGASFQPGADRRKATRQNLHEIMPVPLFFKLPHQIEGRVSDRNVETVDIVPSIYQVIGLRKKPRLDGISFVSDGAREKKKKRIFLGTRRKSKKDPDKIVVAATAMKKKDQTVERIVRAFGKGSWMELFRYGPRRALVGRPLEQLPLDGRANGISVSLDHPEEFIVDPDSTFRPEHITGTIAEEVKGAKGTLQLGLAVNGVIRSTLESYRDKDGHQFTAIVPEEAFHDGANTVQVFVISAKADGSLALQELRP